MQQPSNINQQLPLINIPQSNINNPQSNNTNVQSNVPNHQPNINEILTDPKHQAIRDAEILKTFEMAKLTRDEAILVLDRINNHHALQIALNKLKPFINT